MIFRSTAVDGATIVDVEPLPDERGLFARTWCAREFAAAGLPVAVAQSSVSFNLRKHTLRGMHWQAAPHEEGKLVRCTRGAILDVAVDVRRGSPTYLRHVAVRLDAESRRALFVPPGVAHGFLTLEDATEVLYQMTEFHAPGAARGARWDDPSFGLTWPARPAVVSERDRSFPDFAP